jgi:hypothetical protein
VAAEISRTGVAFYLVLMQSAEMLKLWKPQNESWPGLLLAMLCLLSLALPCDIALLRFGQDLALPCLVSKGKPHHWVPTRGPGPGPKALTTQPLVRTAGHCFHLLPYRSFLRNRLPQVWGTGAFYVLQSVQIRPSGSLLKSR